MLYRCVAILLKFNSLFFTSLSSPLPLSLSLQVFHRTPAYEDGSLCPGDELITVNGVSLRGLSRKQAADIIQGEKVCIGRSGLYNIE